MSQEDDLAPEQTAGYTAPEQKSIDQIVKQDTEDESLQKYKAQLLGGAESGKTIFSSEVEGLKKKVFVVKEGCQYQMQFDFLVQRDIVTGLKYLQGTYRKGVRVDKEDMMMGSYGPNEQAHTFKTHMDEAPSGMLARGSYTLKAKFVDDDKNEHLALEWKVEIKKDWE